MGNNLNQVIDNSFENFNSIDFIFIKIYNFYNYFYLKKFIHFGDFYIENDISIIKLYDVISQPSNILNKISIIDGWSKKQLKDKFSSIFNDYYEISYSDILADTYFYNKNESFRSFIERVKSIKKKYIKKNINNKFFENFNEQQLFIIGSLIDKEGLDYQDKKLISSVIINRLNKNMKLQIDATVLFALTDGKYDLKRSLSINDLKFNHPYNTYIINNLPPEPISYVGTKTIDIILENYNSDFLFYFFNNDLKKHIFSKNFEEHKKKLNEYRNK